MKLVNDFEAYLEITNKDKLVILELKTKIQEIKLTPGQAIALAGELLRQVSIIKEINPPKGHKIESQLRKELHERHKKSNSKSNKPKI